VTPEPQRGSPSTPQGRAGRRFHAALLLAGALACQHDEPARAPDLRQPRASASISTPDSELPTTVQSVATIQSPVASPAVDTALPAASPAGTADSVAAYIAAAAVPDLPSEVRRQLDQKGCQVPLFRGGDSSTAMATRGAFYAVGPRTDWVVACSRAKDTRRSTTIFAFAQANAFKADSVDSIGFDGFEQFSGNEDEPRKPRYFDVQISLGKMPKGTLGEEFKSGPTMGDEFTPWERRQPLHDAIQLDAGASMFYYWTGKRWLTLPGAD
jgi:hypothetical protein